MFKAPSILLSTYFFIYFWFVYLLIPSNERDIQTLEDSQSLPTLNRNVKNSGKFTKQKLQVD